MKTHILTKQILRAFFGILAIIAPEILDAQTAVGTLNGMLSVSPNGATVYTIPIELPAGRAGMTPQLALTYNSQGEDGILGKGWGISGWSFISRVAETEYYDEKTGAVDFIEDGFSLDGNRLILVEQSTHHEFRTEVDEISRIIRHNPPAKNSADYSYFTVQSRDGFTKTYGQNPGSKQTYGTNNPAIRYHLDKITDLAGNYINYEYEKDQANGELYPKKITYALHPNASSQQLYTVEFVYENMPNQNYFLTSYFANNTAAYRYDVRRHLEKIVVKYMDTFKMQYIIGYETGGIFSKKYLKSITLRSGAEQYNPNYFYWLYNSEVKASTVYFENLVNWNCQESIITGDFNGDGFTDFAEGVSCGINKTYVKLNKEGGCYIFKSINYKGSMKNGDFDGDGCDELLITNALNTRLYKLVNGTMMDIGPTQNLTVKYVADFTGDGLADMITKEGSNYFFYAGNPHLGSFFDGNNKKMLYYFNGSLSYLTGNFAGNGKTGLLYLSGITVTHSLIEQNQEGSYRVEQTFTFNHGINIGSIDVGDFNGDGKDDLLVSEIINTNTRNTRIFYCYGEGFENVNLGILSDQWWKYPYLINDFNNDGIADIAFHTTSDANPSYLKINYVKLFKFPGVQGGFKRYATFINQYHELGCSYNYSHLISYLTGDFNGNGEKDICYSLFFNCDVPPKNTIDEAENSLYGKRKVFYQVNSLSTPDDIIYYIADGFGVGQQITYSPYRPAIYNPVTYPVMIYNKPFSVVSKVVTIKPDGFDYPATTYSYKGLQLHAQGKGLLGFQETTVTNHLNNTVATAQKSLLIENGNYYFPYDANIIVRERETNKLLSETVTTMAAKNTYTSKPKVFVPVATLSYTKKWDNDASNSYMGIKVLKQDLADIDNFGNSTKSITLADEWKWTPDETGWGWTAEHLAGYYAPTQQKWLVNPIYTSTKSRNVEGGNVELTSRSDYTYFGNGFLQKTKTTPNNSGIYATETEYSYDALGNIISTTLRALVDTGIPARTTTFEYNAAYEGRFLTKKTVAAPGSSFVTQYAYDAVKALIISETDIRGHSSYYQYDAFGKPTRTLYPDGTSHNLSLQWSTGMADAPAEALFAAVSFKGLNGSLDKWSETIVFYDKYQRVLRTVSSNLQGLKVYVNNAYDANGRLASVSEPYYSTASPTLYTSYAYDALGRAETVLQPDGTQITNTYTGRTTRTTNLATGIWSEKTVNVMGATDLAKDPAGTINYDYDAASRLTQVHALGTFTNMQYDAAGNQTKLIDPNAGTIDYLYNTFGELKEQTDAKGNKYTMTYDAIGRLKTKTLVGGSETTTYNYNETSSTNGFGMPASIVRNNGTGIAYAYDDLGRKISKTETVDQNSYTFAYTYNYQHGMPETYQYPSGFALKYVYNARGDMHEVRNATNNQLLWKAIDNNERNQITSYHHGNGVWASNSYDQYGFPLANQAVSFKKDIPEDVQNLYYSFNPATGNLIQRSDHLRGLTESFTYDPVLKSRLASWSINNVLQAQVHYDNNGNIVNKSDVTQPGGGYWYNDNNKPHAVRSVVSPTQAFLQKAEPQNITYTAFNKIASIFQTFNGPPANGTRDLSIKYNPLNERISSLDVTHYEMPKTAIVTKKYFVDNYEVIEKYPQTPQHLHYLHGGDGLFAIFVTHGSTSNLYYIHKDHLGSYNAITDATGNLVETLSFDPWGRRRNPNNWSYNNVPAYTLFDRGFTGHEYLDGFGLINMNGRVYDPFLARFLSPDPFVQAPDFSQNYNRYSYAYNNPLKYTDPDGEWVHLAVGAFIGGTINWLANGAEFSWRGLGYFGVGALAGALAAGVGAGVSSSLAGGTFGAGFWGTSVAKVAGASFGSGFSIGMASGATNGFVSGAGNSLIQGEKLINSIGNGMMQGTKQGFTGALLGGLTGGITAEMKGNDFWTGQSKLKPFPTVGRLNINYPEQRAEMAFSRSRMNPFYTNSELTFDGEEIYFVDNFSSGQQRLRDSWSAVSGPHGNGQLPRGEWIGNSITRLDPLTQPNFNSYSRDGFDFWMALEPQFQTTRNGIGIHPDGGVFGTSGCIGLTCNRADLKRFFNLMGTYLYRFNFIRANF